VAQSKDQREPQRYHTHFLDQQSLGLRPFLEGSGHTIRDVTEILGHKDTREGVSDDAIIDFLKRDPICTLVTKDRVLAKRCAALGLPMIYVNESEVVAREVLSRIGTRDP